MWTFVTLLIVLLFLIAAAVVIPIVLIVIPRMRDAQASSASQGTGGSNKVPTLPIPTSGAKPNQCDGIVTCQNAGVAILNADRTCNCVCINGFTGKACESEGDAACTTTNISGTVDNATLGSGIPRLFEAAETNFSIPLNPQGLLSLFSNLGLSCSMENALVTFNGLVQRSLPAQETNLEPTKSLPLLDTPHQNYHENIHKLKQRQTIGDVGSPPQQNDAAPSSSPPTQSSASQNPTGIQTAPISGNTRALDFARIGVLLLLQETGKLDDAANAQVTIQNFLSDDSRNGDSSRASATIVDIGLFELDLVDFSIRFRNGTVIQGARPVTGTPAAV
jgi:hypothetical protein